MSHKKKRGPYEIRWKPTNAGRDGGYGSVRSFIATLKNPNDASKKLRKRGIIISVRRAR